MRARRNAKFAALDKAIATEGTKIVFLIRLAPNRGRDIGPLMTFGDDMLDDYEWKELRLLYRFMQDAVTGRIKAVLADS